MFAALAAGPVTVIAAGSAPVEESKAAERSTSSGASQYYNTGVALMRSKNFADAQAHFERALKLRPDFAEAHNNLAYCLRKQGPWNYEQALEHYDHALQLNRDLAEAYEYRGTLFVLLGRTEDAEKDLAKLKRLNPALAEQLAQTIRTGVEKKNAW